MVQTGCVGPIPQSDISTDGPQQFAAKSQGCYLVTLEDGIVTGIDWSSLYYKA